MRIARVLGALALVGLAGGALANELVTVRRASTPAGTILRDAVVGGLAGSAVGGGIILHELRIQDDEDWGRTLAWGAAIGLGAGLVLGLAEVASAPRHARRAPRPVRDGLSMSLDVQRRDQSRQELLHLLGGRF